ncbi:acetyltransferase [Pseudomonas syringae]|uniref:Acetyltransferase n=1 Tax=Pseudomonas syringae TaxID=317 RepID=A0A244EK11_PSESX|nr:acetyltransferase [Pseudomonas syringae]OUM04839.1 acetyltransferase [Pseudomonas syringae]
MGTSVRVISSRNELFKKVCALRLQYIGDNPASEDFFADIEELRDACSYHMVYLDRGEVVGAIRITPLGHGMSFIERVINVGKYFPYPMDSFDANRLVLDERYRGGMHLKRFLLKTAIWLKANTSFRYISALCRGRLVILYVNIGGVVLADNLTWGSRQAIRDYSLVFLELDTVFNTIKGKLAYG